MRWQFWDWTEREKVRAMCGAKLMEKKRTEDLMEMLELKETVVQMAIKSSGVRWYGHVLRRDDGHVLRKALEFEVKGKRKQGRPKKSWKTQIEKESKSVGLEKKNAINQARKMESGSWRDCCHAQWGKSGLTPIYGDKPRSKLDWLIDKMLLKDVLGQKPGFFNFEKWLKNWWAEMSWKMKCLKSSCCGVTLNCTVTKWLPSSMQ